MENKFTIKVNTKKHLDPYEVIFFKSDGNYTLIHYSNRQKVDIVCKTLRLIEDKFCNLLNFIRISKSTILNTDFVVKTNKREVILKNGETLIPSRRRARRFFNELSKHITV